MERVTAFHAQLELTEIVSKCPRMTGFKEARRAIPGDCVYHLGRMASKVKLFG
jgi:hypothetical protein